MQTTPSEDAKSQQKGRGRRPLQRSNFPLPTNREQRQIVRGRSTGSVAFWFRGPPGTGKSHTIANLMCHLLATGKRVLITAETGRALQVLKDKLPKGIQPLCVSLLGQGGRTHSQSSTRRYRESRHGKQPTRRALTRTGQPRSTEISIMLVAAWPGSRLKYGAFGRKKPVRTRSLMAPITGPHRPSRSASLSKGHHTCGCGCHGMRLQHHTSRRKTSCPGSKSDGDTRTKRSLRPARRFRPAWTYRPRPISRPPLPQRRQPRRRPQKTKH